MVAIIKTGHSISRILNYNEQKVGEGAALCIAAANYPKDVEELNFDQKLNRLLHQAALNENVSRNSVHISLNFDPSENLSLDRLREISEAYMQKLGFGEQPYLVYQHFDAGHPHVHLVSIKIRPDGSRIDTQNIGRNQSQKARREIEQRFSLIRAEEGKLRQVNASKPAIIERVQYGKKETKRAISSVVEAVIDQYKYSSLMEFNAVLQEYNIVAERGSEDSQIRQYNGLVYRVLDQHGNKKGVPIRASDLGVKPTLKLLETKFIKSKLHRQQHQVRVKNAIDWTLLKEGEHTFHSLKRTLEKKGIAAVLVQRENGVCQDIAFVDHLTKCVYDGRDLGPQYTAQIIQSRCRQEEQLLPVRNSLKQKVKRGEEPSVQKEHKLENGQIPSSKITEAVASQVHGLPGDNLPHQQKKAIPKKQNRISNHL